METYDTKELAKKLKMGEIAVRRLINSGQLKAKKVGRSYIVTENQLKEFLEDSY